MEPQCEFRVGRQCINTVFSLKLIVGKEEVNQSRNTFLDYGESFNQVNRTTLFNILHKINIPETLISALVKIYEHNEIRSRPDNKMAQ